MKVKAISERKSIPGQIEKDHEYYIKDIWDFMGDWYGSVYKDPEYQNYIANLLLSHFKKIS